MQNTQAVKKSTEETVNHGIYLTSEFTLILQTELAQRFFNGSWKSRGMGLVQFARQISLLYTAAKHDDPYAEWILVKTEQALIEAQTKMKNLETQCEFHLKSLRGLEGSIVTNTKPLRLQIHFSTKFAYMATQLLTDMDYILRQIITIRKLGLHHDRDNLSPYQLTALLRRVFVTARQWRHTGVTRQDIVENNQRAQLAQKLLGTIPTPIFKQEVGYPYLRSKKIAHIIG